MQCQDCNAGLTGHGHPSRCSRCAARARYVAEHGSPPTMLIAVCGACGLEFQDYASRHKKSKHGLFFCSKECRAAWAGVHNSISRGGDALPRSKAEKDAAYYRKTSGTVRARMNAYYAANREAVLARKSARVRALKKEVVTAYGGKCECCGDEHLEFLTIDHVKGDGAEHRRLLRGSRVYIDLKRRGFPKDGFRLLCFNCNTALGFYGYCPHRPEAPGMPTDRGKPPGRKRKVK